MHNKIGKILSATYFLIFLLFTSAYAAQLVDEGLEDQSYTDTFESGWSRNAWVSVSNNYARTGSYSLRMTDTVSDWPTVQWMLPSTPVEGDEYYISFWILFAPGWDWDLISSTGFKIFRARGSDGEPIIFYNRSQAPPINFQWNFEGNPAGEQTDTFIAPSLETWHRIEIYIKYSTSGEFRMWHDGTLIETDTGFNSLSWISPVTFFEMLGGNGAGQTGDWYIDDIEIWDSMPSGDTVTQATSTGSGTGTLQ